MTQRDRPSTFGAAPAEAPLAPAATPGPTSRAAPLWEQWLALAAPAQRQQALRRAAAEGLLYAHQLPAPEGTSATTPLEALLAGPVPAPLTPPAVEAVDPALGAEQRQAVARALHAPDVALILGYPGSGKSRVVTEVLRQAARTGLRVLFTAASSSAIDRALAPLAGEDVAVVRLLGPKEAPSRLPACVSRLCPAEQVRLCRDQALPAARRAAAAARAAVAERRRAADAWPRLAALAREAPALAERLADAERQLAAPVGPTPLDDPGVARQFTAAREEVEARLAATRTEAARLTAARQQHEQERQELQALAALKASGRWWSLAYWRTRSLPAPQPRLDELARLAQQTEARLAALSDTVREQEEARQRLLHDEQEALAARGRERAVHLREQAEARLEALRAEARQQDAEWRAALALVGAAGDPARTAESVEAARAAWAEALARDEADAATRQALLEGLELALPNLEAQLTDGAQVVAGPLDALLGEGGAAPAPFDLLVLEEAHFVRDDDLLSLARRAKRCVLVGEPAPDLPLAPPPRGASRTASVSLFHRLWAKLHCGPQSLPARWRHRAGRLVGTLRTVPPGAGPLHREPVFDLPEIELTILAPAGHEPLIVEVSFPAGTSLTDAKGYIYRELQELAVEAPGAAPSWREDDEGVTLQLGSGDEADAATVALEPGVVEHLARRAGGPEGLVTARLTFARAAGWDRPRAEAWAEERLGLRDLGRTALLTRSYRARPALVRWLADLLHVGVGEAIGEPPGALPGPVVEMVSVTGPARREAAARPNGSPSRGAARGPRGGGAGLEIDLNAGPRGEVLPADLRHVLPREGVVNLAEARAVVQALEALVADPAFRAASAAWQARPGARRCDVNALPACPTVAVLGLLPEQAELLRLLVSRSGLVANAGVPVEVATPVQLAQRECLVALVSLTRSHTHRAVPFCEHPDDLLLALTRPAARLVLFGDPGTMARRGQWHGALDHLDEITGPVEQALMTQLLARWPEPESPARAARPRESSSV